MQIREAKRGKCRTCNSEVNSRLREEYPDNYWNLSDNERKLIHNRIKSLEDSIEKGIRTSTQLFALEAHTASGSGTEIICERHLREFTEELNKYLKSKLS